MSRIENVWVRKYKYLTGQEEQPTICLAVLEANRRPVPDFGSTNAMDAVVVKKPVMPGLILLPINRYPNASNSLNVKEKIICI